MANDDNVLTLYLKDINKIPLLTREEENNLAVQDFYREQQGIECCCRGVAGSRNS